MSDQSNIYIAKLHWVIFFWPTLLFFGSFFLGSIIPQLNDLSLVFMGFSLVWGLMVWSNYYFSSLTITPKQVTIRTGVLVRKTIDIAVGKIESIDIRQSLPGSIFQYGQLVIVGTGGTHNSINNLSKPLTCRRYIEQLMHG